MRLRVLKPGVVLEGKCVLVRVDGNVPVAHGEAVDGSHGRIARSAVGIDWLRQRGAKVIVITHLGRPDGKKMSAYSVKPIARRLSELLGVDVKVAPELVGAKATKMVEAMKPGDILMLENVRFDPREEHNSPSLAQALAAYGDLFVNDAFGVCHRAHASVDAITSELPAYAGPLLSHEVEVLSKVEKSPRHPFVLCVGGLKMEGKIPVMERLLPSADRVLVGGALSTAFLAAKGLPVGRSVYDEDGVRLARRVMRKAGTKLILPEDVLIVPGLSSKTHARAVSVEDVGPRDVIVDIGPRTLARFVGFVHTAKMIVWNGPLGYCEREDAREGTVLFARSMAARSGKATTVVGGGDTVPIIEAAHLAGKFTLVSTGGGAMLDFLAGAEMPGLRALEQ